MFGEVMRRAHPARAHQVGLEDAAAIRREIDRAVPLYAGIGGLARQGDVVQWGGPRLYADGRFATADGRAHFAPIALRSRALPADRFFVSTRRGKQFNSMVQRDIDPLTGADRDDILISDADLVRLGRAGGDRVRLRSATGRLRGPAAAGADPRRQPRGALARGQRAAGRRAARSGIARAGLQRGRLDRVAGMRPDRPLSVPQSRRATPSPGPARRPVHADPPR